MPAPPLPHAIGNRGTPGQNRAFIEKSFEIGSHFTRRLIAILRRLGQCLQNDCFQIHGNGAVDIPERPRLLMKNLLQQLLAIVAGEQRFEREQFVKRHS